MTNEEDKLKKFSLLELARTESFQKPCKMVKAGSPFEDRAKLEMAKLNLLKFCWKKAYCLQSSTVQLFFLKNNHLSIFLDASIESS